MLRLCPFFLPLYLFLDKHMHASLLIGFLSALIATYPDRSYYGGPDYECNHCGALFWYQERVVSQSSHRAKRIAYNLCCRGGKISLPAPKPFPPILQDLIRFDGGAHSNSFMRLIRQYNSLFAFTSLGANIDRSINTGPGPYVFISMVLSITELVLWFLLLDNVRNSPSCTYMTPPMSSRIGLIFLITLIILGMSLILLLCKSLSRCLISSILLCSSSVLLETRCFLQVLLRLLSSSLGQAILRVTVKAFPPPLSWQHWLYLVHLVRYQSLMSLCRSIQVSYVSCHLFIQPLCHCSTRFYSHMVMWVFILVSSLER